MNPRWTVALGLLSLATGCATWRRAELADPHALTAEQKALSSALAHYAHGLLLESMRDDAALAAFMRAAEHDPASATVRQALVVSLVRRDKADVALELLTQTTRAHPGDLDALHQLARLAESLSRYVEAEAAYAQLERRVPEQFTEARLSRVRCLFRIEQDERALVLLAGIAQHESPQAARAYLLYWTRHFLDRQQPVRADAAVAKALTLCREGARADRIELLTLRGDIHRIMEDQTAANRFFRDALQLDPSNLIPAFRLAHSLRQDPAPSLATLIGDAPAANPDAPLHAAVRGAYHLQNQQPEMAVAHLERLYAALETRNQSLSSSLFQLYGGLLIEMDRRAEAISVLREGLNAWPDDPLLSNNLAYTLAELNQEIEKAYQLVQVALASEPKNAAYLDTLGWIYYRKGQFEDALKNLKSALAQQPDDPVILDHVGDALLALERTDEAITHWRRSYAADPSEAVGAKLRAHGVDPDATGDAPPSDRPERAPLLSTPPARLNGRPAPEKGVP